MSSAPPTEPKADPLSAVLAGMRGAAPIAPDKAVRSALAAVRTHLGMPVAFLSEFAQGRRWFRYVDTDLGERCPIQVGGSDPLEDSYCQRVVDGRLPALLVDATRNAEARTLAVTTALPVGSHLSVPVRFSDGSVFGTFCCFDTEVNETLVERDVAVMRMLAELVAGYIEHDVRQRERQDARRARVGRALDERRLRMVFQPIVSLADGRVVGHEALARFEDSRAPDHWFREAGEVGLGVALEQHAAREALERLALRPPGTYIAINFSPDALLDERTLPMLLGYPLDGIVVELTEHVAVGDYPGLLAITERLRKAGARIAVDDAGAGYAGLHHILQLRPRLIKLDTSLTRRVADDLARQALIIAMVDFATRIDAKIVAEGVERAVDAAMLLELGVGFAQGYHFGRPGETMSSRVDGDAAAQPRL